MTSVPHFGLCGVLFLLYAGSVNTLKCKQCSLSDPACKSGNVPDATCSNSENFCFTLTFDDVERQESHITRGCTTFGNDGCGNTPLYDHIWMTCIRHCNTDSCNNKSTFP